MRHSLPAIRAFMVAIMQDVDARNKCGHDDGETAMPSDTADRLAIRALIENWVLWRDARMWDRFRTVWHSDGHMWATWFQGTYEEFIKVSQEGYDRGVRIMHMLGGMSDRHQGQARHRADQDDHLAARRRSRA